MKWALSLLLLLFCIGTISCAAGAGQDIQAVKDTIMRYDQLLAEGYAKMNMTPLKQVATEEHSLRVYHHMAALGEAKVRMESELKGIEFEDIRFSDPQKVMVKTKEMWDYRHVNYVTQRTELEKQRYVYRLNYELVKSGGRWLVVKVVVVPEEKPGQQKDVMLERDKKGN